MIEVNNRLSDIEKMYQSMGFEVIDQDDNENIEKIFLKLEEDRVFEDRNVSDPRLLIDNRFDITSRGQVQTFTIPVGGLSRQQAERQIASLIMDYQGNINWDAGTGEAPIDNWIRGTWSPQMDINQYWFPASQRDTSLDKYLNIKFVNGLFVEKIK